MKSSSNQSKRPFRQRRRTLVSTAIVASVVLAVGAITVLSRSLAPESTKSTVVDLLPAQKQASQDFTHAHSQDAEPQELSADDAQKLAAGLKDLVNQSTEGLVEVRHADGSVSLDQQGRFQSVTVSRINKDGRITHSCVENPQAAASLFGIDPKLIDPTAEAGAPKGARVSPVSSKN